MARSNPRCGRQLAQGSVTELVARAVSHLRLPPEADRRLAATSAVLSRERGRLQELLIRLSAERSSEAADVERKGSR